MANKRLKILFLSRYQANVSRGVETYVSELSKRLSKNHHVEVWDGKSADSFTKLWKCDFDIIIPTNGRFQSLKASISRLKNRAKIIIAGQAGIGRDDIWNIFFTVPNVYVALTEAEVQFAKNWAWGSKITKIPNGVDLGKFNSKGPKVETGLSGPVVLSVGALEWYKYHEKLIRALSLSAHISLLIVGVGSENQKLQKLGDELLGKDRFRIMNFPFDKMPDVYRSVDLFSLPSWDRESFGIVYLEALATNLPVIAPNDLSRQEIVGKGGILINTNDPEIYINAINHALNTDWKDKPRNQAEKFSWDNITKSYEKLFNDLIS